VEVELLGTVAESPENSEELVPIGVAVETLRRDYPDISHSSLRFLEREGLVRSSRTSGGHRLYRQSDIEQIALIKNWQRQGRTLEEIRQLLDARQRLCLPVDISEQFLRLALESRLEEAGELILQADNAGIATETLFFEVLRPALVRLGELWASGQASVHQEKEISVLARELVIELTQRHTPTEPTKSLLISACAPGERHEIGISMVNGLLRQNGYRVRYLGPDVETEFLINAIRANRPSAVLLTSSIEKSFPGCLDAVDAVRNSWSGAELPLIFVGGEMVERRAQELVDLGAIPVRDVRMMLRLGGLLSAA